MSNLSRSSTAAAERDIANSPVSRMQKHLFATSQDIKSRRMVTLKSSHMYLPPSEVPDSGRSAVGACSILCHQRQMLHRLPSACNEVDAARGDVATSPSPLLNISKT